MMITGQQRIVSGATWVHFCEQLKQAGEIILAERAPDDPLTRAEGFRYLTRITRAALLTFVEHNDPLAPVLQRVVHETAKMGADNPDNYYLNAAISGEHEYRLWGNRGTVHYLSFGTQRGHYGQGAGMPPTGFLSGDELQLEPNGDFSITLSARRHDGNWLPMERDTGTLIVRQTYLDKKNERLADLHIERLGAPNTPSRVDADAIDHGITQAGNLVMGASMLFAAWADGFKSHENRLPPFDAELSRRFGGDPNISYFHSYWRLAPDEALVIEATPPDCDYWNFQLNNHWMESLDYRYYTISINKHTATYRDDGSVRVVVAARDPGVPNWIDTVGHEFGTMCWRWVRANVAPEPSCRVVKLAELGREL